MSCIYDSNDCDCTGSNQDSQCYQVYIFLNLFLLEEGNDFITLDDICGVWSWITTSYIDVGDDEFQRFRNTTCIQAFNMFDINNDTIVSINEALEMLVEFDFIDEWSSTKAAQVNCSSCWIMH